MSAFVAFETHDALVWIRRDAVLTVRMALPTEVATQPSTRIMLTNGSQQFVVGSPDVILVMLEAEEAA